MKRNAYIILSSLLICLGAGCASSGKTLLLTQRETIALVSIVANDDINWKGEESIDPNTTIFFTNRNLRNDPDKTIISKTDALMESAEMLIRETLAGSVINLAERRSVLQSKAYLEAQLNKYQINRKQNKPKDFRFIDHRDKNFFSALAAETGIQRTMFVDFNLTKSMKSGVGKFGSCQAEVEAVFIILDVQGKTIIRKKIELGSLSVIDVSGGVYSHSELMSVFESTIIDACYEFLDYLEK